MSARSLNKVMLIGNITRDPNLRFTPNNAAVCSFGLATNRSWMPTDGGEKQESVEFHNIVAWSKLAEICSQLLHKGDKIYVDGRLQTRSWKADDGVDRRITEVVIENMILLRSASDRHAAVDEGYATDDSGTSVSAETTRTKSSTKKDGDDEEVLPEASDDVTSVEDVADDVPF